MNAGMMSRSPLTGHRVVRHQPKLLDAEHSVNSQGRKYMRIALFGATGHIGAQVVRLLVKNGHNVTVLVRDSSALPSSGVERLNVIVGDARKTEDVAKAIKGQELVINAMGPGGPGVSNQFLDIITDGTRNIIRGMKRNGVKRLIALGAAGTLSLTKNTLLRDDPGFPPYAKAISGAHLDAWKQMENSGLDWTIVIPAPTFRNAEMTGKYRVSVGFPLSGDPQETWISYEDIAHFVNEIASKNLYIHERVTLAY